MRGGSSRPNPSSGKKKAFVTFPFPYMNGPLHIGHCFTATRVDIYARFKRMQGYNVLFPWAWHWTGESIPGMSYRLSLGDESVKKAFLEIDGVPPERGGALRGPGVPGLVLHQGEPGGGEGDGLLDRLEEGVQDGGPGLQEVHRVAVPAAARAGYVVQGTHPVVWCKHDESPTGDHDRMEGEGVSPEEFNLIKFKMREEAGGSWPAR